MLMILPFLAVAASAISPNVWDLRAGDQTIFRFDIRDTPSGVMATWERPAYFETDGDSFTHIRGPAIQRHTRAIRLENGDLKFSFDDPGPGATPDIFRFHRIDSSHADVLYERTPFESFVFTQAPVDAPPLRSWDKSRKDIRKIVRPTNMEMTSIFNADQADRETGNSGINWEIVGVADKNRRSRTQQLLDSGLLHSGADFFNAAFVFQHGDTADDFLKAHLLAMIAVARGNTGAVWIASATLDRYLQAIGKPQVLGTQFMTPKNAPVTQEPYDRTLVSDEMRKALHVSSIAEQAAQQRSYQKRTDARHEPVN